MSVDRRSYARFPISKTPCRVEIRGAQHHVFQSDMSINGLGIVGLDFKSLEYGEKMTVHFEDESVEGVCCSAHRREDGELHIGVKRSSKFVAIQNLQRSLVKRFVDCGECEIPCEILSSDPLYAVIRLRTGKSFKVPMDKLNSRTRNERVEYLADDKQLSLFLDFYQVDKKLTISAKDNRFLIDRVVELEFGAVVDGEAKDSVPRWQEHPMSS